MPDQPQPDSGRSRFQPQQDAPADQTIDQAPASLPTVPRLRLQDPEEEPPTLSNRPSVEHRPSAAARERGLAPLVRQGHTMRGTCVALATSVATLLVLAQEAVAQQGELVYVPNSTKRVCQLTGDFDRAAGKPTLSQTDKRFGVWGTDLGSSFEHKGKLFFLFGDTVGRPGARDVLAWTNSTHPDRIVLDFYKAKDGKWLPLTVPGIRQADFEVPSGGISIGGVMYVVCTTDHTEKRVMSRSVLASSHDDGRTFKLLHELSRTKFLNVSLWLADGWLYIYGSGEYRKSSVYLARIKPAALGDRSRLSYFAGTGGDGQARWSAREADAVALFDQPQVGEFSVSYLKPVKHYVMLYNAQNPRGITMRSARTPWGPWSEGTVVFHPWRDHGYGHFMHISAKFPDKKDGLSDPRRADEWGGEYGPYLLSRFTTGGDGRCRIYYTMSTWNPYQVHVMHSDLRLLAAKQIPLFRGIGESCLLPTAPASSPECRVGLAPAAPLPYAGSNGQYVQRFRCNREPQPDRVEGKYIWP
jgi:hypothetical protein